MPRPLYPGERVPGTHWIGDCVDLRVDLDDIAEIKILDLLGLEAEPLGRPARSQSLYRLSYSSGEAELAYKLSAPVNSSALHVRDSNVMMNTGLEILTGFQVSISLQSETQRAKCYW
jgi:hypothetical protein